MEALINPLRGLISTKALRCRFDFFVELPCTSVCMNFPAAVLAAGKP